MHKVGPSCGVYVAAALHCSLQAAVELQQLRLQTDIKGSTVKTFVMFRALRRIGECWHAMAAAPSVFFPEAGV
jgi:hypothetical protein